MNILIYFPYNQRTVEQQSVMEMFVNRGHNVYLLTLVPEYHLHTIVRKFGVNAFASPVQKKKGIITILKNTRYLISFCKRNSIDVIIAHQQETALPLIFAAPFIKSKTFYVRHNTDEHYKQHPKKTWLVNHFINAFLPNIIAPSNAVYNYMTGIEKVPVKKIQQINYGYNFDQYEKPDQKMVSIIREKYDCEFLVVSIARMVPAKRHIIMFNIVKALIDKGLNIKMVCLGAGPLKEAHEKYLVDNNLHKNIFLTGIQTNIFDYLTAADILMHLSESEASNSVVKESGLANTPAIVCDNVGDFDDYVVNNENSFLVNKQDPFELAKNVIEKYYYQKDKLQSIGKNFHETIVKEFNIDNVVSKYETLLS